MKVIERALDPLMWAWCWLACQVVGVIPITRRHGPIDRFRLWLLPFAGFYAYHDPALDTVWRWSERNR